uniref:C2H2-type domain-containing protein n=1 Tax=Strongyloides papillosus TaxID=174720 RepID=A0A0N5BRX4_STREA
MSTADTIVASNTDKSFLCEICSKAFRFRSNLAEHRSVHSNLKPYVCGWCGKSSRLKGNLTKHILKHHKAEQNAYIGTDDIIIKKGKKSVKDPAAIDFLEKSMIVLTPNSTNNNNNNNLPNSGLGMGEKHSDGIENLGHFLASMKNRKRAHSSDDLDDSIDGERDKFLMSLGLEINAGAINSNSPTNSAESNSGEDKGENVGSGNNVPDFMNTLTSLAAGSSFSNPISLEKLIDTRISNCSSPSRNSIASNCNSTKTQCPQCGKHFRKQSSLQVHMTVNHGAPPPGSSRNSNVSQELPLEQSPSPSSSTEIKLESIETPVIHNPVNTVTAAAAALSSFLMNQNNNTGNVLSNNSKTTSSSPAFGISFDSKNVNFQNIQGELKLIKQTIHEINRNHLDSVHKLEKSLTTIDNRVDRLEKQLEMALNSIYTLVQLQTGINTNVTRFRDDACEKLKSVKALLSETSG